MPRARTVACLLGLGVALALAPWLLRGGEDRAGTDGFRPASPGEAPPILQGRAGEPRAPVIPPAPPGPADRALQGVRTIRGQVVAAADGAPVEGAWVATIRIGASYATTAGASTTDAEGRFEQTLDPARDEEALQVVARGFRPRLVPLEATAAAGVLRVELDAGREVQGRVEDEQGNGIGDVRVWCFRPDNTFAWPHTADVVEVGARAAGAVALSEADGSFTLRGLDPEATYGSQVGKPGWIWIAREGTSRAVPIGPRNDHIRFVMTQLARMELRAVDATSGRPVPAELKVSGYDGAGWAPPILGPYDWVHTGLDAWSNTSLGRMDFLLVRTTEDRGMRPSLGGVPQAKASALGYEAARVPLEVRLGEPTSATIALKRRPGLEWTSFRVRALLPDDKPFEGDLLLFLGDGTGARMTARLRFTDGEADGGFDVPRIPLHVHPYGGGKAGLWWGAAGPRVSWVPDRADGEPLLLRLVGTPIEIDARDPADRSVRGFGLTVNYGTETMALPDPIWDTPGLGSSDASGIHALPFLWVRPGQVHLRLEHPGYEPAEATVDANGDGKPLRVRLSVRPKAGQR